MTGVIHGSGTVVGVGALWTSQSGLAMDTLNKFTIASCFQNVYSYEILICLAGKSNHSTPQPSRAGASSRTHFVLTATRTALLLELPASEAAAVKSRAATWQLCG